MALAADRNGIRQDVLRQGHARHTGIPDVVQVRAGHLAPECDLPDGRRVCPFLRGTDGGQHQPAVLVDDRPQPVNHFDRNARNGAGRRDKHNIGASLHKCLRILGRHDVCAALARQAGCVHLSGRQNHPVAHRRLELAEGGKDRFVGNAVSGVAGQQNQVHPHIGRQTGIVRRGQPTGRHLPQGSRVAGGAPGIDRFQVNPDHTAGQAFQGADRLPGRRFRQGLQARVLHVKHVQQQDIRPQRRRIFSVGHIAQQRRGDADGLAHHHAAFAPGDGFQQLVLLKGAQLTGGAVKQAAGHSSSSSSRLSTRPFPRM